MGCESNLADTNRIRNYFNVNGANVIKDYKKADIIILMSCGFNQIMMKDNLARLNKFNKTNAKVLLGGCIPKIKKETTKLVDDFFGPKDLDKLDQIFNFKTKIKEVSPQFNRKAKSIIRISTGCEGKCSYCAIKIANGITKSRKIEDIKKDIKQGLKEGYSKFVFTAEDTGSWGKDIGTNILGLLTEIIKIKDKFKVTLTTINPKWFIKFPKLIDLLKSEKIEKKVYLSLQSGSNRILRLMNRQYSVQEYRSVFDKLKKEIPEVKIQVDVIVGFPTETKKDFLDSLQLIKELNIYFLQVFAYTDMEGTISNNITPKIPYDTIEKRAKEIILAFLEKNKDCNKRKLVNTNIKNIHKLIKSNI